MCACLSVRVCVCVHVCMRVWFCVLCCVCYVVCVLIFAISLMRSQFCWKQRPKLTIFQHHSDLILRYVKDLFVILKINIQRLTITTHFILIRTKCLCFYLALIMWVILILAGSYHLGSCANRNTLAKKIKKQVERIHDFTIATRVARWCQAVLYYNAETVRCTEC